MCDTSASNVHPSIKVLNDNGGADAGNVLVGNKNEISKSNDVAIQLEMTQLGGGVERKENNIYDTELETSELGHGNNNNTDDDTGGGNGGDITLTTYCTHVANQYMDGRYFSLNKSGGKVNEEEGASTNEKELKDDSDKEQIGTESVKKRKCVEAFQSPCSPPKSSPVYTIVEKPMPTASAIPNPISAGEEPISMEEASTQQQQQPPSSCGENGSIDRKIKNRKDFEYRLKELKRYKTKYGDCMVPHKFPKNPSLGTWVDTQRRRYRAFLRSNKNQVSAGGSYNVPVRQGNGKVPLSTSPKILHRPPTITNQPTGTMTPAHVLQLRHLGFVFEPRLTREETWNRRLEELGRFKKEHRHCNVREDDTEDYPGLGKWVSYVRRQYRLQRRRVSEVVEGGKRKNRSGGGKSSQKQRLSDERIHRLISMGFVFELKEAQAMRRFREGLTLLKEFWKREGHVNVPKFYPSNPTFGLCVEEMRKEYRSVCKFVSIGGGWGEAFWRLRGGVGGGSGGKNQVMEEDIVRDLAAMGFLLEEGVALSPPIRSLMETSASMACDIDCKNSILPSGVASGGIIEHQHPREK